MFLLTIILMKKHIKDGIYYTKKLSTSLNFIISAAVFLRKPKLNVKEVVYYELHKIVVY